MAMGNPKLRMYWEERLLLAEYELHFWVLLYACISIGMGTVIMDKAAVQTNVKIGKECIISMGAVIDHDVEVGDYCHINVVAVVAAGSRVTQRTKVDYNEAFRRSAGSSVAEKELQN